MRRKLRVLYHAVMELIIPKILIATILILTASNQVTAQPRIQGGDVVERLDYIYVVSLEIHPADSTEIIYQSGAIWGQSWVASVLPKNLIVNYIDCHFGLTDTSDRYVSMRVSSGNIFKSNDFNESRHNDELVSFAYLKLPLKVPSMPNNLSLTILGNDSRYITTKQQAAQADVKLIGYEKTARTGQEGLNRKLRSSDFALYDSSDLKICSNFNTTNENHYCAKPVYPFTSACDWDEGSLFVDKRQSDNRIRLLGFLTRVGNKCDSVVGFLRASRYTGFMKQVEAATKAGMF